MLSKWSIKQMELWETTPGEFMEITFPVMQSNLSGDRVREERICMLFSGRKSFGVLSIGK